MSAAAPSDLRRRLLHWYDRRQRDLPWRRTDDRWAVWVSEIMLQQTTVDAVIPYWTRFLKRFPDPGSLVRAREATAIKAWEGLGYYTRVRNLRKAAARVVQDGWPTDARGWQQLPGIGPYTAAALASILDGEAVPVVDGNVFRVMSRWHADTTPIDGSRARDHFAALAVPVVGGRRPGDVNQALMELGATVCRPRQPDCTHCPWARDCSGRDHWQMYPRKSKTSRTEAIDVAVGIVRRPDGRFLMDRRADHVVMGGLWEFPGGKIERDESPAAGVVRELKEETGLDVAVIASLPVVRHAYTRFRVTLHPFLCRRLGGRLRAGDEAIAELAWKTPADWKKLAMPAGSRKILQKHRSVILETT